MRLILEVFTVLFCFPGTATAIRSIRWSSTKCICSGSAPTPLPLSGSLICWRSWRRRWKQLARRICWTITSTSHEDGTPTRYWDCRVVNTGVVDVPAMKGDRPSAEMKLTYREISNIRHTRWKNSKCFLSRLAVVFAQSIEARCSVENEDVVGAAPTGDTPTTSEWSTN